jgi:hypothetical protein
MDSVYTFRALRTNIPYATHLPAELLLYVLVQYAYMERDNYNHTVAHFNVGGLSLYF